MNEASATQDRRQGRGTIVCIPTYNERDNIELIVPAVLQAIPQGNVLVIDDNSPDGTGDIAERLSGRDARVHVLHRAAKEGLGKAYLAGFEWALARNYDFIFEFDADFSHNPKYLPGFIEALENADVVIGSRRIPGGGVENWGLLRRLVSWGGSRYAQTMLGVRVRDLTGGFNGFRAEVLRTIGLDDFETTGYGFQIEVKYRAIKRGFRVIESPIVFPDRERGQSKMNLSIMSEAMINVIRLRLGR